MNFFNYFATVTTSSLTPKFLICLPFIYASKTNELKKNKQKLGAISDLKYFQFYLAANLPN